ncbi:MraY family glycosyltransferase [Longimicrobium sp.]|uniref:MraY family glycosyltransferase n=1 Tax=Longimicrobium sp. TaxID=2029185 RepID=UPI002C807879|nr:MraY family glycosyltransferase [Longimicrobium sp.]HSU15202.1 MraY family glycosyltransferase [Longimicrobium sp.]
MAFILTALLVSVGTAVAVTPLLLRFLLARGIYGHARVKEGVEHKPVPRLGGVAVCLASSLGIVAALPVAFADPSFQPERPAALFGGMLLAGWILFAAGVVDDLYNLPPRTKLLAQLAAALLAWQAGFRIDYFTVFGGAHAPLALRALSLPITVLWIVGVTNAFNLIDGLDGLATGIGLVALSTTLAVAVKLGNWEVALVCAALAGALAGFLRYNFRPARIFLGDSGSLFVGFMLAVLSVHGATKSTTAVLTVIPLLVLALPLIDTLLAIVRRWLRGKPIFGADERHVHHRLVAIGLTHTRAAVLMFTAAAGLAMLALLIAFAPPPSVMYIAAGGGALSAGLLLFGIKRLGYHEFVEAGAAVASGASRLRRSIRDRIHARDVAQVVSTAESVEHLRAILSDNADVMGLLDVVFCRCSDADGARGGLPAAHAAAALKVDFPIGEAGGSADPWVVRAWCDGTDPHALPDAVRTVHVLADAVREWMVSGPRRPAPRHAEPHARGAAVLPNESPAW